MHTLDRYLIASGLVTYLVLHQGGRDMKARRTSDKVVEHKEIAVSPKILAQYTPAPTNCSPGSIW